MTGNRVPHICSIFVASLVATVLPQCNGLFASCSSAKFRRNDTILTVGCEINRPLYENETAVWILPNCTAIGTCSSERCISFKHDIQTTVNSASKMFRLYVYYSNGSYFFVFSVHDSLDILTQSYITSSTREINGSMTCTSFLTNISSDYHQNLSITEDHGNKINLLNGSRINASKFDYANVSTIQFATENTHSSYQMDMDTTFPNQSLPNFVVAIIAVLVVLALLSSFGTCFIGCRIYKSETYRLENHNPLQTPRSNGNITTVAERIATSSEGIPCQARVSFMNHALANPGQPGEANEHIYETPDVVLADERSPLPSATDSDWHGQQSVRGLSNEESQPSEFYNKLERQQIAIRNKAKSTSENSPLPSQIDTSVPVTYSDWQGQQGVKGVSNEELQPSGEFYNKLERKEIAIGNRAESTPDVCCSLDKTNASSVFYYQLESSSEGVRQQYNATAPEPSNSDDYQHLSLDSIDA